MTDWLALVIGNTRWHWSWFKDSELKQVWHTPHLSSQPAEVTIRHIWADQAPSELLELPIESMDIWAVSVVPIQSQYLAHLSTVRWIHHVPLPGIYPTMGLDRVITLWGAIQRYGWPVLIIDCGTAITFTAGADGQFIGGAILLGVRSQLSALKDYTAALPKVSPPLALPPQWATDTPNALQSGVINTILAGIHHFIQHWQHHYPSTAILFTGGDGQYLYRLYKQQYPTTQNQVPQNRTWFEPNLMFWGIAAYRNDATRAL
ncbi:MAG: pantothenate kinase [Cyanobacteria bacterium P01_F01_bin.13]